MTRQRLVALFVALFVPLLAALLLAAAPATADDTGGGDPDGLTQRIDEDQAVVRDDAVLDVGHVDLGPRYDDGAWSLMVHDDTSRAGSVWRPLDHVAVRVLDTALVEVPDDPTYDFLGVAPGTQVHVVPQTQDPDVVWLGWNTQDPEVMRSVDRGVTLSLVDVDGPGDLVVYLQDGGFGAPDVFWDSRQAEQQPLWVDVNTHTHANWVFTRPGLYRVGIQASATLVDGSEESALGTVRFAVGDETPTQEALAAAALTVPDEDPSADAAGADADDADSDTGDAGGVPVAVWLIGAALILTAATTMLAVRGRRVRARALGGDR